VKAKVTRKTSEKNGECVRVLHFTESGRIKPIAVCNLCAQNYGKKCGMDCDY
jgi:hypothetical protein